MTNSQGVETSLQSHAGSEPGSPTSPTLSLEKVHAGTLIRLFRRLQAISDSQGVCLEHFKKAIPMLNRRYGVGLQLDDAARLFAFLGGAGDDSSIQGDSFADRGVPKLVELLSTLQRLSEQLTLMQLRVVVLTAFERFDSNNDGVISVEELAAASEGLGLSLKPSDCVILHSFLLGYSPDALRSATSEEDEPRQAVVHDVEAQEDAPGSLRPEDLTGGGTAALAVMNDWDRLSSAIQGSLDRLQQRRGWGAAAHLAGRLQEALHQPGSPAECVARAARVARDGAGQASATALDISACALALLQPLQLGLQQLENLAPDVVAAATAVSNPESPDAGNLLKLLPVLGAGACAIAAPWLSQGAKPEGLASHELREDESLLYALIFHSAGCSAAELQRLLLCKGCRWGRARRGEVLDRPGEKSLKITVRGRAQVAGVKLRRGSTIGETLLLTGHRLQLGEAIRAKEEVTYVAWDDIEALRSLLDADEVLGTKVRNALAAGTSRNLQIVGHLRASKDKSQQSAGGPEPEVESWRSAPCGNLILAELVEVLRLAALSSGRLVVPDSLVRAARKTGKKLTLLQAQNLLSYLDRASRGEILSTELLKLTEISGDDWRSTCQAALASAASQAGLLQCWASLENLVARPQSSEDPLAAEMAKMQLCSECMAEALENLLTVAGTTVAISGLLQSFCIGGPDATTESVAPLVSCLAAGAWSLAESHEDVAGAEAAVYLSLFRPAGFSPAEFRRLIHLGGASWESLDAGASSQQPGNLKLVVCGKGSFGDLQNQRISALQCGSFLGEAAVLAGPDGLHGDFCPGRGVMRAEVRMDVLSWKQPVLQALLKMDLELQTKVKNMVTHSLACRLVGSEID